jgi:membrane protease YdiL (CAAX protease family)
MIQPLEKSESRKVIYSVLIIIGLHICWLLTSLFLRDMYIAGRMLITRTTYWLCFGAICWYAARIEKQPLLLWPEKRHPFVFYIGSLVLMLLMIVLIAVAIALPLSRMGFKPSNLVLQILTLPLSIKLYTVITAGVVEELVFRGYIQSRLQLLFKTEYPPILLSALCFALLHASYGTLINILMPFIIGLIFAFHYYKYRNIKILIICHLLIDANALLHTTIPKQ